MISQLPWPTSDEILFVHSLSIAKLREFVAKGICYSQDDNPSEVDSLYEASGHPELKSRKYASLNAYIAKNFQGRHTQRDHSEGSNLHLILNVKAIAERALVFNGDVATLAADLHKNRITIANLKAIEGAEHYLFECLDTLTENNRNPHVEPRLRGLFEARLFDGIRPEDVSHVCIENSLDQQANELAVQLYIRRNNDPLRS